MNNWKKYTLAALVVTAAGFAYLNSSHRNIPADFRDAVADKGFDTTMPIIDKEKGDVPVPKAAVPVKTSNIPSAKKLTAAEQKAAWAKMRDKGELTDKGYAYLLESQKDLENMEAISAGKPVPYPERMPVPAKKLTAAEQKAAWAKMRDKGELTDKGYAYLLESQKDLENMEAISAGKPVPYPERMPVPAKKLTAAEQKAAWAKMRDKGELTDEGYNYLLEMQKVMESMVQMSAVR